MAGTIKLQICDNADEVATRAAAAFSELIRSRPEAVIGLATGSTPEASYAELARLHCDTGLSFAEVTSFNLDEYWGLGGDHDQSYRYFMNDRLFKHVDIQTWNTHVLNGRARFPELECRSFEDSILAVGGIDLWLLGIGGNGHIAFNEPGSPVDSRTRLVSLSQETIASNSDGRFFSDPADVPRCALSAGIGTIREASALMLLATGEKKADAIATAVEGPFSVDCPASLLQDHADCTFIIDAAAASKLTSK
jgi:glucosamine-6-phosphate deaminase